MPSFQHPGVYVEETTAPLSVAPVATAIPVFLGYAPQGPLQQPARVTSFADYEAAFGGLAPDCSLSHALDLYFENGGGEALVSRLPDPLVTVEALLAGLALLDEAPFFTLLVLPDAVGASLSDADRNRVWQAALALCEKRLAFLIMDAPADVTTVATAAQWWNERLMAKSRFGACYAPWVLVADPLAEGGVRAVPPSGAVAGLYARSDAQRGVWKAPAGSTAQLRGVAGLAVLFDNNDQGLLNPFGINLLRSFTSRGLVCFGARTLVPGDGEWRYVPSQRLASHIEESLRQGLTAAVFEPDSERTWIWAREKTEAFLQTLFRQGAFAGGTVRDAYFVRCDRTTMTQNDIDQGRLVIEIGIAPLRPAEFVIFRIGLWTADRDPPPA